MIIHNETLSQLISQCYLYETKLLIPKFFRQAKTGAKTPTVNNIEYYRIDLRASIISYIISNFISYIISYHIKLYQLLPAIKWSMVFGDARLNHTRTQKKSLKT